MELNALVYVESSEAKRLDSGMRVLLSPAGTSPEENGYLEGYIYYVSRYPATQNGMHRVLRNQSVVERLSENGLPLAVEVRFFVDSTNRTGYKWTSSDGPDIDFVSGTFASAMFFVDVQKPVDVFMPFLAKNEK
jgi:HlyD family secretion protein